MIKNSSSQDNGHSESSSMPIPSNLQSLREAIEKTLEVEWPPYHRDKKKVDELLTLFTQHAISELERLTDEQENSQDWERAHPGYSVEMIQASKVHDRIAELKAQQEGSTA